MKYSLAAVSAVFGATLVAGQDAQRPQFHNTEFVFQEGMPTEIKFAGCPSGCTISVRDASQEILGAERVLTTAATDSSPTGGSIPLTLEGLASGRYALEIRDNANKFEPNYSIRFSFTGTGSPLSGSSTQSSAATTGSTSTESTAAPGTSLSLTSTHMSSSSTTSDAQTTSGTSSAPSSSGTTSMTRASTNSSTTTRATTTNTTIPGSSGVDRLSAPIVLVAGAAAVMAYLF